MSNTAARISGSDSAPRRVSGNVCEKRKYLYSHEVHAMVKAARKVGRNGVRDACLILTAYRHGLRVRELVDLQWSQISLETAEIHVRRRKNGRPAVHPVRGDEIRRIRALQRACRPNPYVFVSERRGPLTTDAVRHIVRRAGRLAGVEFPTHPHQLRHACGFALARKGVDTRAIQQYLGHRCIEHTVIYTELASNRFDDFFVDEEQST